ncbi:hypothetical protein HRbin15_02500 [bacterium HR15]|nr:hypothetical protein HRbin15_02500 [bacterium HR15]
MGSNRTKWLYGTLALTGVSSFALAQGQTQGTAHIVRGAPGTLTLQLHGVTPAAVEVEIDGVVVAHRQVSGKASSLQLTLNSAGLPPGMHEATVRLYDSRGRLISTLRGPIELLPDPTAPITIIIPRHGTSVSGTVPIEVRVSGSSRPYVSFFIDGQVRTLRNYAPYVYHWDTTRERNGWHAIQAWSFDGNQTFKSPITRVFVNNPGGRTERQMPAQSDEQVGLNEPTLSTLGAELARAEPTLRTPETMEGQMAGENRLSRPAIPPAPITKTAEPARRETPPVDTLSGSTPAPQEVPRTTAPVRMPTASYRVAQVEAQPNRTGRLSIPPVEPEPAEANRMATLATREHYLSETLTQLRPTEAPPRMRGQKLAAPQIALAPASPTPAARATAKAAWLPVHFGTRLPANITRYEVLLDARPVPFDVEPRVQNGIPLVAIRQIAEQAGGKVRWDHQHKVATVELAGRIVTLDVRANRVVLNDKEVPTETPLQIVNGRVIAPAALWGKVLNAELTFDPNARQLHINTQ